MAAVWRLFLILLGFAIATVVAALAHTSSVRAQETSQQSANPNAPAIAARGPGDWSDPYASPTTRPDPRAKSDPFTDPGSAYETLPRRMIRNPSDNAEAPDDPSDDPADKDPADRTAASDAADASGRADAADTDALQSREADGADRGQDQPPIDGDLSAPIDSSTPADGVVDLAEPVPLQDGADPTADTRPEADVSVFNQPPAGFDPLLFQIEDVDPLTTDRRPERLARFEPYDPIGIRIGSFVYFPELVVGGVWTDNVLSSPDPQSDIAAEIASNSRLVSNWSVHALEFRWTTLTSFYDEFPTEDDRAWSAEARGRLDISRRTNIQGLVSHSLSQESRQAVDAIQTSERADVTSDLAQLTLNHRFNRLAVQLRGSINDTTYSDTDGQSNRDRDTLETTQAVRTSWEFKPTLSVFAEEELNQREKEAAPPEDGIPRDSEGTRTRVGLDFGATGAIVRGEVSLGYGRQTPDDNRLAPVDTLLFDANLSWRPTEVTSLLLTARTDIYETTTAYSGGVAAHTAGLELRHAFQRYLIATAGLIYTNYNYSGVALAEDELTSYLMAEYYASPEIVLFTRYEHLDFASNEDNADYDSDEIRFGVRVRR